MNDKKTEVWLKAMKLAKKVSGCHQMPQRSFFIAGYQFPLCARCSGIVFGYILALILFCFGFIMPIWLCVILAIPLIIDGGIQLVFNIMSNNIRRFVTGTIYGVAVVDFITKFFVILFT